MDASWLTASAFPTPRTNAAEERLVSDLFERHADRLFRLALRMTADREAARDLAQEAFLRLARRPDRVPDDDAGREAWLVRMVVNLCRDRFRRRAVRERAVPRLPAARTPRDPEAAAVARATVARALARLPAKRRAVIVICELEGQDTAHAARLLGMRPATVRWHLSVGRRALAAWLTRDRASVDRRPRP